MNLLLLVAAALAVARPSAALSYGPSFLQEPPAAVLYSNNTGLVLGSRLVSQSTILITFRRHDNGRQCNGWKTAINLNNLFVTRLIQG